MTDDTTSGTRSGVSSDSTVTVLPDRTTIVLRGEVDAGLAGRLAALAEMAVDAGRPVLVDVADVTFMDSTGAAFIAGLVRGLGADRTTVANPSGPVRFLLTVTRLTSLVRVVPELPEVPEPRG